MDIRRIAQGGLRLTLILLAILLAASPDASGWSCRTHTFIAKEAGIEHPQAVCFPDLVKRENYGLMGAFHWHNAAPGAVITPEYIDRYGVSAGVYMRENPLPQGAVKILVPHPAGVLYWKICDLYEALKDSAGWEYDYYLAAIAHYVGDLSQPLHSFPFGNRPAADGLAYPEEGFWAKNAHLDFDRALDPYLPLQEDGDKAFVTGIPVPGIASVHDLKREISRIANASITLANACYTGKRCLTKKEALTHAAMSIALLKAVMAGTKR